MAGRRRVYGRRRRINILPIIIIILAVCLIYLIVRLFGAKDYNKQIDMILESDIIKTTGTISSISSVDTQVYKKDGFRYTNQHDNIRKLNSFDSSIPEDAEKINGIKLLLDNYKNLKEDRKVDNLPVKENGYYWINANFKIAKNILFLENEKEYTLDFYYDIDEEKIYVKEKYYDEFSRKNNDLKLQSYEVDENYKNLINDLPQNQVIP